MPQDLSLLANLRSLDISDNELTGEIPVWISSLPELTTFKASSNKLSGNLYDFASMSELEYVDLSDNLLRGEIPTTLLEESSKNNKIVVTLSNNRLSGTIPSSLQKFSKLSIHLSDNQITAIGGGLCSMRGWNDYDVSSFGCDGLVCPVGMANAAGRQTSDNNPCVQCSGAKYMGSTACKGNGSSATRPLAMGFASLVAAALLSFL
jgi:Leucine-rich repeat (LRR) protein